METYVHLVGTSCLGFVKHSAHGHKVEVKDRRTERAIHLCGYKCHLTWPYIYVFGNGLTAASKSRRPYLLPPVHEVGEEVSKGNKLQG